METATMTENEANEILAKLSHAIQYVWRAPRLLDDIPKAVTARLQAIEILINAENQIRKELWAGKKRRTI